MLRQDYVLRLIEQLARALRGLLAKIRKRELSGEDVRAEIADIARQSGLDLDVAHALDIPSLLMWLAPTGEVDPGRFWLMGELLFLEGLESQGEGLPRARAALARAEAVFAKLDPAWRPEPDLASAGERTAEIHQLLDDTARSS